MPPLQEKDPALSVANGDSEEGQYTPLQWRTLPWLGIGLLVIWGGQRWLRDTPVGAEQRVIDGSFAILLGSIALGKWAFHHRQEGRTIEQNQDQPPASQHWIFGGLAGLAAVLVLVSVLANAATQIAAWLRLGALLLFLLAGLPWPRKWTRDHLGRWGRSLRIGLTLTGATILVRLLLVATSIPDWDTLAWHPTVLGDLYQVLGSQRAVLLPFALGCFWPAGVWWACRHFARESWALTAGILAVLSPFQIWQPFPATQWGLVPYVFLFTVVAARRIVSSPRPGGWFWLGLGLGILWGEAVLWRFLILSWILFLIVPLFLFLINRPQRPDWIHVLYAGLGLVAGLLLHPNSFPGEISGLTQGAVAWGGILYPPRILTFWFQPEMLELRYSVTYFLFLDGLLALMGLILILLQGLRRYIPALGVIAWVGGMVYASQDSTLFISLAHMTAIVPSLLAMVALPVLMPQIRQLVANLLEREIPERWLVTGAACLFIWLVPGGILGFNPLMQLRDYVLFPDVADSPQSAPLLQEPITVADFVGDPAPPWLSTLVWQTAGTCHEGVPVMTQPRGVTIDLTSRQVHVVGQEPGMLVTLAMDENGRILAQWSEELQDPVEVAVLPDGTFRILDAGVNGVWSLDMDTGEISMLIEGHDLYRPRGFQVLPDGQMLVADTGSNRVVRYGADGSRLDYFGSLPGSVNLEQPTDVLEIGDRLWVLSPQQSWLREMYSGLQLRVTAPSHTLAGPHMSALADGTFLLTDSEAGRILYMGEEGHLKAIIDPDHNLVRPVDIDVAEDAQGIWMAVIDSGSCRVSLGWLDPGDIPTVREGE